ncbi:MAG: alpha/beta fold hydrolase [Pseudomonadota bacterium]
MIDANETFNGTWPFKPNFTDAPGFRMHYVDEGRGEPILCIHGEPMWGYLYRKFIPPLSETNRVVVPDHMGFGKSETPQDRVYTLKTHVENLIVLVDQLELDEMTLVIQDWGGPMGGALLATMPDRIKRVFVMNTVVYPFCDVTPYFEQFMQSDWFRFINSDAHEPVLKNLRYTALSILKLMGFQDGAIITDEWVRAYSAPFDTPEECIGAIEFPLDIATGRFPYLDAPDEELVEKVRQKPAMLANGMQDRAVPPEISIGMFKQAFGNQPVVELSNAGHFCQEDAPEILIALLQEFIQRR